MTYDRILTYIYICVYRYIHKIEAKSSSHIAHGQFLSRDAVDNYQSFKNLEKKAQLLQPQLHRRVGLRRSRDMHNT